MEHATLDRNFQCVEVGRECGDDDYYGPLPVVLDTHTHTHKHTHKQHTNMERDDDDDIIFFFRSPRKGVDPSPLVVAHIGV